MYFTSRVKMAEGKKISFVDINGNPKTTHLRISAENKPGYIDALRSGAGYYIEEDCRELREHQWTIRCVVTSTEDVGGVTVRIFGVWITMDVMQNMNDGRFEYSHAYASYKFKSTSVRDTVCISVNSFDSQNHVTEYVKTFDLDVIITPVC